MIVYFPFLLCSCFLSDPIVFFVAFLGPVFSIMIFNTVIIIIVVVILVKHTRGTLARKKESIKTKKAVILVLSITGIMFLFGNTWLFAVLIVTVDGIRIPGQVLFVLFTSTQGFFIFVFFCILSKESRESWKEVLSFGRYKSAYLHPTMKWTKNTAGMNKDGSKNRFVSHGSSSDYTSKNSVNTSIFSSNGKSSSCIGMEHIPADKGDKSNIYSKPTHPGGKKKEDLSSSFAEGIDEGNIYSETGDPEREEMKEDLSRSFAGKKDEISGFKSEPSHPESRKEKNEQLSSTVAGKKRHIYSEPETYGMDNNLSAIKKTVDTVSELVTEVLSGSKNNGVQKKAAVVMETNMDEEEDDISIEMDEMCIEFFDDDH